MMIDVALGLYLAGAIGYWWLSPKGFPVDSSRFWLNSVLPWVFGIAALLGLVAVHRKNWRVAGCIVLGFSTTWLAGAIAARVGFPVSLRVLWLAPLLISISGFACFTWIISNGPRWYRTWISSAITFAILGVFVIWAEVPPPASTKPINARATLPAAVPVSPSGATSIRISDWCEFDAELGSISATFGDLRVECSPLLDFHRISPDGIWSPLGRRPPGRHPTSQLERTNGCSIRYSDNSVAEIFALDQQQSLRVVAYSTLERDTYSHLNTYAHFSISGHKRLSLIFSPCPDKEIEVLPADYPVGRPARMACLQGADQFCVVEATSGEKGPFASLANGKLMRGQPLTITICDARRPVASFTLNDWSQQASTELSPTAGWGLPMNAIEFQRLGGSPASPVGIWISLAATSVGRGWDTVGHCAGTYRNTIEFRRVDRQD